MCQRAINSRLLATGRCHSGLVHKQREVFLKELLLQSTTTVSQRVYQSVSSPNRRSRQIGLPSTVKNKMCHGVKQRIPLETSASQSPYTVANLLYKLS